MPIDLFAYFIGLGIVSRSVYPQRMPVKSLITLQNQTYKQLGIDPAFEEAGSGSSRAPALSGVPGSSPGRTIDQPARYRRNVKHLQSEI
jgi:hypothetical protein